MKKHHKCSLPPPLGPQAVCNPELHGQHSPAPRPPRGKRRGRWYTHAQRLLFYFAWSPLRNTNHSHLAPARGRDWAPSPSQGRPSRCPECGVSCTTPGAQPQPTRGKQRYHHHRHHHRHRHHPQSRLRLPTARRSFLPPSPTTHTALGPVGCSGAAVRRRTHIEPYTRPYCLR